MDTQEKKPSSPIEAMRATTDEAAAMLEDIISYGAAITIVVPDGPAFTHIARERDVANETDLYTQSTTQGEKVLGWALPVDGEGDGTTYVFITPDFRVSVHRTSEFVATANSSMYHDFRRGEKMQPIGAHLTDPHHAHFLGGYEKEVLHPANPNNTSEIMRLFRKALEQSRSYIVSAREAEQSVAHSVVEALRDMKRGLDSPSTT